MARKRALIPKKGMSNACNFQMVQEKKKEQIWIVPIIGIRQKAYKY